MASILEGKSALITGASRGIGKAIAAKFIDAGCTVHLAARDATALAKIVEEHPQARERIKVYPTNLATLAGVSELAQQCGTPDILVNNAGAIPGGSIEKVDDATWTAAWDLKVFGYIRLIRELLPKMYSRGGGVVLNIIGMAGVANDYDYVCGSAGNAALIALTNALGAKSTDKGVRVLGINPTGTKTDRIERLLRAQAEQKLGNSERWQELLGDLPFGRLLEPDEIAELALFLVSDRASYLSGTVINMDGGRLFR